MNVPNILTVSRLGFAVIMMICLTIDFPLSKSAALVIFVIAGITDYLDGHLARNVYGITSFGKLMDPLADKIIVCAAFVSFVEHKLVAAWLVVIIISREFLVTGLRLLAISKGQVISAGKWGKHKTVWQIVAIIAILLGMAIHHDILNQTNKDFELMLGIMAQGMAGAVALITAASGWLYFVEHRDVLGQNI